MPSLATLPGAVAKAMIDPVGASSSESPPATGLAAGERVVAAGVEDDDVHAVVRLAHAVEQLLHVHRVRHHVGLALDATGDRDEVVVAVDLHPVAGEVEEADAVGAELGAEVVDRLLHLLLRRVDLEVDFEVRAFERAGDRLGVVARVRQRGAGVVGVADHEREARVAAERARRCLGLGGLRRRRKDEGCGAAGGGERVGHS